MDIPDIEELIAELSRRLVGAWESVLEKIKKVLLSLRRQGELYLHSALTAVRVILHKWPEETAEANYDILKRVFSSSFATGMIDTELGVYPDQGDMQSFDWLTHQRNGFLPAIKDMSVENQKKIEQIITSSYTEPDAFDLDLTVRKIQDATGDSGKSKAELIVRTESAKISALGRIFAWGKDNRRDWYNYYWIATPDDRVKDISLKFEREGPYDYDTIKRIWEKDHNEPQLVRNRKTGKMEYQISAFNCRCTCARAPKSREALEREGKVSAFIT